MFCMAAAATRLRLARPQDAPAIARLSRDLIEAGLGWKYDAAAVGRAIADTETLTLVADDGSAVAGFAIMQFGDEVAHLSLLAVLPRVQRQGVGRRLLQWQIESAATAGMSAIELELRASNPVALGFYRALGFTVLSLVPGYYRQREAAIRMQRVLRRPLPLPALWQPPKLRRP
jgi:ribosomal-protein-alanine N-acetyltransferase